MPSVPLLHASVSPQADLGDEADENGVPPSSKLSSLPYKLVFAVGCTDSVIIYDTGARSFVYQYFAKPLENHELPLSRDA